MVLAVAVHQIHATITGPLTAWKGGGFGMYTTPHGTNDRAVYLHLGNGVLRLTPPDPAFTAWVATVDPGSAEYLAALARMAAGLRHFPTDAAARRLMDKAARVQWDASLLATAKGNGGRFAPAQMRVTVTELARRPSVQAIDTRVVFAAAGSD